MKLKPWIHSALHIGCVTVLLLQGHRIQQIQKTATADHAWQEEKFKREIAYYHECQETVSRWQIFAMTKGECSDPRCIATAKKVVCTEVSNK